MYNLLYSYKIRLLIITITTIITGLTRKVSSCTFCTNILQFFWTGLLPSSHIVYDLPCLNPQRMVTRCSCGQSAASAPDARVKCISSSTPVLQSLHTLRSGNVPTYLPVSIARGAELPLILPEKHDGLWM